MISVPTPWHELKTNHAAANFSSLMRGAPEVVSKITRSKGGYPSAAATLDYVSRDGQLELITEEGEVIAGRTDLHDLKAEWRYGGVPMPSESQFTEVVKVVLSAPEGTDPDCILRAARDTAEIMLAGHQYAMVLHDPRTDPSPNVSRYPHVHIVVKAMSLRGVRYNLTLGEIDAWRKIFAANLRALGVEVTASWRFERFMDYQYKLEEEGIPEPGMDIRKSLTASENKALQAYAKLSVERLDGADGDPQTALDIVRFLKRKLGPKVIETPQDKEERRQRHREPDRGIDR
ncbi:hypothetical protein [Asticcacaulis sp. W401b]|uniref:hypothetical protein n=1 Tax=Asticcacaulis sp. W401b TaxID=3388666 RepID=UPI003970BF0B